MLLECLFRCPGLQKDPEAVALLVLTLQSASDRGGVHWHNTTHSVRTVQPLQSWVFAVTGVNYFTVFFSMLLIIYIHNISNVIVNTMQFFSLASS